MTEEELLKLLSEQLPRELTPGEIEDLRRSITVSEKVRLALTETIQLDQGLVAALAQVDLSVDLLLEKMQQRRRLQRRRRALWWAVCGLAGCLLLAWMWPRAPEQAGHLVDGIAPTKGASGRTDIEPKSSTADPEMAVTATDPEATETTPEVPRALSGSQPTPASVPTTATSVTEGPWTPWISGQTPSLLLEDPRRWGDLASRGLDQITRDEFERWWQQVPGLSYEVHQDQIGQRPTVRLGGWARLRAPWLSDTQLSFVPFDVQGLTFIFWQGDQGIAFKWYREREPHMWGAFRVQRRPGTSEIEHWGLLSTDSGAMARSGSASASLSLHHGRIGLSVGDIVVLSVPFEGLPTEVFIQGPTRLRGLKWLRAEPVPIAEGPKYDNAFGSLAPAGWSWETSQPEAIMLHPGADGSISVTSTAARDPVRAFVRLPEPGLYAAVMQVASADPGCALYLGNEAGEPLALLAFARDRSTRRTTFMSLRPQERREESDYSWTAFPPPYFVEKEWFRIGAGLGQWQVGYGPDEKQFGYVQDNALRDIPGSVRSVGILCLPGPTPRTITLQQGRLEKLSTVRTLALADADRAVDASLQMKGKGYEHWWAKAWRSRPSEIDLDHWLDHAAVITLENGPDASLVEQLVSGLLSSARARLSSETQLQLLDELALLSDITSPERAKRWSYDYLATRPREIAETAGTSWSTSWRRWLLAPIWSPRLDRNPFQQAFTSTLLTCMAQGWYEQATRLALRGELWLSVPHPDQQLRESAADAGRVAQWSLALASERVRDESVTDRATLPASWRHPLSITLQREAHNVRSELLAALETQAYGDAARIVTSLNVSGAAGLVLADRDGDVLQSLAVVLEQANARYPLFASQMQAEAERLGMVRAQQAMRRADEGEMSQLPLQHWGTAAAAAANAWLGDRAISRGDLISSILFYERAQASANSAQAESITPRLELARGMAGLPYRESGFKLQGQSIEETLRRAGSLGSETTVAQIQAPAPLPAEQFRWEKLSRLEGQAGHNAGQSEAIVGDPFGKQFSVVGTESRVLIHNRFKTFAIDPRSGAILWTADMAGEPGNAHAFSSLPFLPVPVQDRVLVRQIGKEGVGLAALRLTDGQLLWKTALDAKTQILTDPVVIGSSAWAICGIPGEQQMLDLVWSRFSMTDGRQEGATPLLRLRDEWDGQIPCTLSRDGMHLVGLCGGTAFGFDLGGSVAWVRRQTWLPAAVDPSSHYRQPGPPILRNGRVYLSALEGRQVQCLQATTGELVWSWGWGDLLGLWGVDDSGVIVAGQETVSQLDPETGSVQWTCSAPEILNAVAFDATRLQFLRRALPQDEKSWPVLVEIDRPTGRLLREVPWEISDEPERRFGPWWAQGSEIWALAGTGRRSPHRDLVRLTKIAGTDTSSFLPLTAHWSLSGTPRQTRGINEILPGWSVLGVPLNRIKQHTEAIEGVTNSLEVRCEREESVQFVARISERPRELTLRFAQEAGAPASWQAFWDGQPFWTEEATMPQRAWRDVVIPLPARARPGLLEVRMQPLDRPRFVLHIKKLELSP